MVEHQADQLDDGKMEKQFAVILADAAKLFADTTNESLDAFMKPPMRTVDDLTHQLDLQNERFSEFRAKRHAIFGAIATVFKPVEMVGDIISGAAAEVFAPSQNIYSAVMYLINAANDVSSVYDSIIELFEQLKVSPPKNPVPLTTQTYTNFLLLRTSLQGLKFTFSIMYPPACGKSWSLYWHLCLKYWCWPRKKSFGGASNLTSNVSSARKVMCSQLSRN